MAKVLCVLYDDPVNGYPNSYARDSIPKIERYPGGQTAPTPKRLDFTPGALLGCVSGELGLRKFLEGLGHTLIVTSDKEGENSVFERELPDAEIVISQPFWPAYLTAQRIAKAQKLSSRSPRASARTTSLCKPRSRKASRSPRSPIATASACRSMW